MTAAFDETDEIRRGDCGRAVIAQGVIVNQIALKHCRIEGRRDLYIGVVHEGIGRDGAGPHPQDLPQKLGLAEAKTSRAERLRQPFEIDHELFSNRGQEQPGFAVLQKQTFAMRAGDLAAQRTGFLDREDRRMCVGLVADAQLLQPAIERSLGAVCLFRVRLERHES